MKRPALVVLTLLALAAVAAWLSRAERGAGGARPAADEEAAPDTLASAPLAPPSAREPSAREPSAREPSAQREPAPEEPAPAPASTSTEPRGGQWERPAHVRVVCGESGEPLAGATCSLEDPPLELVTDADGLIEFPGSGHEYLTVELDGYASTRRIVTRCDEPDRPFEIALQREAALSARVTDGAGRPLEGAIVAVGAGHWPEPREARTDASGSCRFERLPARTALAIEWRVALDGAALARKDPRGLVLAPGELREWIGVLAPGVAVSGTLVDEHGAPVEGGELALRAPDETSAFRLPHDIARGLAFAATTDARGRFEFRGVPPGDWRVDARALEGPLGLAAAAVDVRVAERDVPHVLVQAWRGLAIRGRVLFPDRTPFEPGKSAYDVEATSGTHDARSQLRDDGSFELAPLAAGVYRLTLVLSSEPAVARAGEADVELFLAFAGGLSGAVTRASGAPAAGATVVARSELGPTTTTADDAGAFELPGLAAGRYLVIASTSDGDVGWLDAEVAPDETRAGLALRLAPGARLRVRLSGGPVGQLVYRAALGGRTFASGSAARAGSHPLVLPAGRVELHFEQLDPDGAPAPPPQTLELAEGEERTLVVTLGEATR